MKTMNGYTLGIKDLDNAIEGIKGGSNILMIGPPLCGKEYILYHIMHHGAANENAIINVTTRETATHVLEWFKKNNLNLPLDRIGIIDCVTKTPSGEVVMNENIKIASISGGMTGIGLKISQFFDDFFIKKKIQKNQLYINSLSTFLMDSNAQTVFRFLHVITKRIKSIGGLGIYLIDGGMHNEQEIATLRQLFDGIIEIESEKDKNFLRIRIVGLTSEPTSWFEYEIEGTKVKIKGTSSPSLTNTPNPKLTPLSRKAKFFMARSEIPECKPLSDAINSAGEIFYKFTANENIDFEHLNTEFNIFNRIINISEQDKKHIAAVREQTNLRSKLKNVKENFHLLETATFLTDFGYYKARRKSILSAIVTIKNACKWGISGLNSDHDKLVESIHETIKEIDVLKNITTKSSIKPVKDDEIQKKQYINKEVFRYISGRPNEGFTKINLGYEEIISITETYSTYTSEDGKKYSFDLIKTRCDTGNKRYIFKIDTIYVAGVLIDKDNKVIASYVESFLNEADTLKKLSSAISRDTMTG
jgi:KaiC/GvpD/RAD55 family RecA-like ATPase